MNNKNEFKQSKKTTSFSNNNYPKSEKEARTSLFQMANEQILPTVTDPKLYGQYLSLQARLGYNVINTLLVLNQRPNATVVKDFNNWKEKGMFLKKGEKGIQILEPNGTFAKKDGSTGINYRTKYVYDISQTTEEITPKRFKYNVVDLVNALTLNTTVLPKVVEENISLPSDVYYDLNQNCILIKENLNENTMMYGLFNAYCLIENYFDNTSFINKSVSYMLCVKYNIDIKNTVFNDTDLSYFLNMNTTEVRENLYNIKKLYDVMYKKIENGLKEIRIENRVKCVEDKVR